VFIVVDGTLCIEFEDQTVTLETGEMLVVPKGTRHRPYAEATCSILLVEPTGVYHAQTGIKHSDGVRGGWPYRSANPVSHDEATQDRLWDLSETLVTELKA